MNGTDLALTVLSAASSAFSLFEGAVSSLGRHLVTAGDLFSLSFLILSGPVIATAVLWYYAVTLVFGKNIPKMAGVDLGHYTKTRHPQLHRRIDILIKRRLPWLEQDNPVPEWPVVYSSRSHPPH